MRKANSSKLGSGFGVGLREGMTQADQIKVLKLDRKNKKKNKKGGMKVQGYSNYQTNDSPKRSVSKGSNQD